MGISRRIPFKKSESRPPRELEDSTPPNLWRLSSRIRDDSRTFFLNACDSPCPRVEPTFRVVTTFRDHLE